MAARPTARARRVLANALTHNIPPVLSKSGASLILRAPGIGSVTLQKHGRDTRAGVAYYDALGVDSEVRTSPQPDLTGPVRMSRNGLSKYVASGGRRVVQRI